MSRTRSIKPKATEPATRTASGYAYALPASTSNDLDRDWFWEIAERDGVGLAP